MGFENQRRLVEVHVMNSLDEWNDKMMKAEEDKMTKAEEICSDCGKKESEIDIYKQGENITVYAQSGTLLCPDCIPEQAPNE